jgi:DNA-binding NarL/FixJ family response regulator
MIPLEDGPRRTLGFQMGAANALIVSLLAVLRAGLGEAQFIAAVEAGSRSSALEQALLWRKAAAALTNRQLEVLLLVADGKSNREIARALVVSEKTVEHHLSTVFSKLGVSSRAAATALAFRAGIV